jgi:hypothetical protein
MTEASPRVHRRLFAVASVILGCYVVNIALRIAHIKFNVSVWRLDDVGEFLLVLLCMVAFVAGLLALERRSENQRDKEE